MAEKKPIKLFCSALSGAIFASRSYKDLGDGRYLITGEQFDVSDEFHAIARQLGYVKPQDDAK